MTKRDVDWILVDALAMGSTHRDAAKTAGVSERTVRRRLEEREFQAAIAYRRAEFREMVGARVITSAELAVSTLVDVMHNGPPGAQVKASVAVLDRVPLATEPPAPPQQTDPDFMARMRRKLDEMAERMKDHGRAERTDADGQATNRTKADKTGHNRRADTFPDQANPFPPDPW